ncbi:MAG: ABC transporter ATP-binding protein [Candidatus Omnitrophica bacterium]|nr:ABC transporter ATP-binding protein [Candidatus Omnitrophota bacterium]
MVILKLENISKYFIGRNGKLPVLKNINLEIEEGEFLCIVGPSGCGKTTLLNIIAGLERSNSGVVLHKGKSVDMASPERILIFQELGLFPWLTVQKNVEFGLRLKKISSKEREKIALEYLDMVNLIKFKSAYIHELSGGMKQRVALARALAINPEVLLMDEPFTSLDAQTRDILHVEIQKIWSITKKTIVFVTHNVREAVCLGNRVIVFSSTPTEIKAIFRVDLERPRHIEDHGLMEIARLVLSELKFEIEKVFEEEFSAKTDN